ncbi:hypothetical protein EMPS_03013 [Entomortierella parvispora]|uniref:NAD-dependent epimerase/dehydratase domain-containing protein n=1 Tax=Entomortierella parvispora TaxID=205924 RepID=A0A9P3H6H7_9FUNG|nr:hypothetical protein EMPS_03013 [Entomortierella parvispora]
MAPQPTVLIFGGVGFIGRNFVAHLVENGLAGQIRVVDKVLPQTAYLNERFKSAFSKVNFMQGDLSNTIPPEKFQNIFKREDNSSFDYVINFASETKLSQPAEIYNDRIYKLSINCAQEAAKRGVKVFVQVSTADVYEPTATPSKEDSKTAPWNALAAAKLKVDEELLNMPGLNVVIVRPAVVYGIGSLTGLTPRLICGRVYQQEKKTMELLWDGDRKINTVHVHDVVRAIWHSANWYVGSDNPDQGGKIIFNLADQNKTDQEAINAHIRSIFGIQTEYKGNGFSAEAEKDDAEDAVEESNDLHMGPWYKLLKNQDIKNSPLTPYLDKESLFIRELSVDGSKICISTGFQYEHPKLTEASLREIITDFQTLNIWPKDQ